MRTSKRRSGPARAFAPLTLLLFIAPCPAWAEPFSISRWTVDGGGVSFLQAGSFTLWGSTGGQPDAAFLAALPYRLTGGFWGGSTTAVVGVGGPRPPGQPPEVREFRILPAAPNPLLARTRIAFEMPVAAPVDVRVFAVDGRCVRTLAREQWPPGRHALEWDACDAEGRHVETGLYFMRVRIGTLERSMKLAVMR